MTLPPLSTLPPPARPLATGAAAVEASGGRPGSGPRPKRRSPASRAAPYLFLAPYFLITAVFFVYPLVYATILAFYQTAGPRSRAFVGLANFRFVLTDPYFHKALWNTTVFAFFSLFLQLPLSLGLALLLNARNDRLKGFFRLAIFAPNLVGQVFVGILFTMLFFPHYGIFNQMLQLLIGWGLDKQWLMNPELVMPAIVIAALWMYVGFNMVYFLAALQNVDQSLVEAARIDGAGPQRIFWHVTIPAIAPVAMFVFVSSTIGSFQLFELPFTLLQGSGGGYGPKGSGLTIVGYLFQNGFENGDLGLAATVGWLLTFIILLVSIVQIRIFARVGRDT